MEQGEEKKKGKDETNHRTELHAEQIRKGTLKPIQRFYTHQE